VDRYCPSPEHLTLLLSLLTSEAPTSTSLNTAKPGDGTFTLNTSPGLIILWDLAALLMEWEEADENALPDDEQMVDEAALPPTETRLRFKPR
jgi:hypothetical protein